MSEAKMPERWEMPLSCDYRPAANGDWVRAEDVEPLVAEITRLRARVAMLERIRAAADDFCASERSWYWGEKLKALQAALEAKP